MKVLEIQGKVSELVGEVKKQLDKDEFSRRFTVVEVDLDVYDISKTGFRFEASTFKEDVVGTYKLEGNYNNDNECILFKLAINRKVDGEVKTIHYEIFKNDEKVSCREDFFENDIESVKAPKIKL